MAFELTLWAVYVVVIEEIGTNWAVPNINVATSKTRNFLGPVKDYSLPLHSIEEHDESGRSWFKHQNGKLSVYEHPWNYMDVLATGGNASLSAADDLNDNCEIFGFLYSEKIQNFRPSFIQTWPGAQCDYAEPAKAVDLAKWILVTKLQ